MCETEIALMNAEEIGYSTPHTEAYKILVNPTTRNDYDLLLESEKYNILTD